MAAKETIKFKFPCDGEFHLTFIAPTYFTPSVLSHKCPSCRSLLVFRVRKPKNCKVTKTESKEIYGATVTHRELSVDHAIEWYSPALIEILKARKIAEKKEEIPTTAVAET